MTDDLVERVARRICNTAGSNWNAENFNQTDDGSYPEDQREYYRMLARAAIAVVLEEAARVADGYARTRTYTRDLFDDGNLTTHTGHSLVDPRKIAAAIRAMVKE